MPLAQSEFNPEDYRNKRADFMFKKGGFANKDAALANYDNYLSTSGKTPYEHYTQYNDNPSPFAFKYGQSGLANTPGSPNVNPGDYVPDLEVDPNSLVENRMTGLMDSNNPYIERARSRGLDFANSRGMLNSSLAETVGERAAIDAALPIAQQDASTYGNTQAMKNQALTTGGLLGLENVYTRSNDVFNRGTQMELANMDRDLKLELANKDVELQKWLSTSNISGDAKKKFAETAQNLGQQYQVEMTNILTNSDLDSETKMAHAERLTTEYNKMILLQKSLASVDSSVFQNPSGGESLNSPAPVAVPDSGAVAGDIGSTDTGGLSSVLAGGDYTVPSGNDSNVGHWGVPLDRNHPAYIPGESKDTGRIYKAAIPSSILNKSADYWAKKADGHFPTIQNGQFYQNVNYKQGQRFDQTAYSEYIDSARKRGLPAMTPEDFYAEMSFYHRGDMSPSKLNDIKNNFLQGGEGLTNEQVVDWLRGQNGKDYSYYGDPREKNIIVTGG